MVVDLKIETADINKRLKEALFSVGLSDPNEAAKAMEKIGRNVSPSGIRKHIYGQEFPSGKNIAGNCLITGRSADWLLFGKEPPHPTWKEILKLVEEVGEREGLEKKDYPLHIEEIIGIILPLREEDQKSLLALIRAYASEKHPQGT